MAQDVTRRSWLLDQLAKSTFFHAKLHEWDLLDVLENLEHAPAAAWDWPLEALDIATEAWRVVVHAPNLTPVMAFAHPEALRTIPGAVRYYRMLSMVSQKSMQRVGLPVASFEEKSARPDEETAWKLARHFNRILSMLFVAEGHDEGGFSRDEILLWRGMAAGTQAQGAWQNVKGREVERLLQTRLVGYLRVQGAEQVGPDWQWGNYRVHFSAEPDIAVWQGNEIVAAVEIKGGIDAAGVLERLGAAVKSLQRVKDAFPAAVTVLVLTGASLTMQAQDDLHRQRQAVNVWYLLEDLLESPAQWQEFLHKIRLQ